MGTSLDDAEHITFPPELRILFLSFAKLHRIPDGIKKLTKLTHLRLSGLALTELPDWLPDRMFLTDRTLYVVLLNVRDGTQDEWARYWLHNIKSFAPKAPVLVVLNQMDENPNASINENGMHAMAPCMTETVKMSALTYTREEFNSTFTAALLRQIDQMSETLDFFFPATWTKVKQRLRTMEDHYIHGDNTTPFARNAARRTKASCEKDC